MKLLEFLKRERKKSASVAKERLQIIVAHQRSQRDQPDYMPMLERELLEVIRRYVNVDQDAINISLDREDDCSVLELNVTLPRSG
ncbi:MULTISPECIES: cell division topological specificity factor MinE [Halomonadaceae]|uniref:Cell division topological specificity factor n=2 Tax=Modicisalibacter TaxID=574347 RepID=A0A1I3EEC7_9GAMM|nr:MULTISPECIES: cell division topological specificity factor MinE [Halomonas]MCG7601715.1 cell division topological specificity factor MinE [Halomonas sp. McH1-25]MCP1343292.1 cell division topological specificity factor MinE [Halomonas sp. FL8]MCP1360692.1 cell division topological specificity factor MinE [Halomonas sp. BBD45]TDX27904.1 cell division topological specificity factor MinE [Halomonas xianhensis]SFH97320.1 cell division topological specificity factor MinE [Halomonas xianhensis]